MREHVRANDIEVLARDNVDAGKPLVPVCVGLEHGGVVQVSLGAHDGVGAGGGEAARDVFLPEDVAVCKEDDVAREVGANVADGGPVGGAGVVALLVARAAVDCEDGGAGGDDHFSILERAGGGVEEADFSGDRDGKGGVQGADQGGDEGPVVLEEGTVAAFASDALWTAEVQVNGVAVGGDEASGGEEVGGGIGAELDKGGTVGGVAVEEGRLKRLGAVGGGGGEETGVEHGRIAEGIWG